MEKTTGKPFNVLKDSWQFTGIKIKNFGEFPGCLNLSFSLTKKKCKKKNIAFENGVWIILSYNGAVKCHDSALMFVAVSDCWWKERN